MGFWREKIIGIERPVYNRIREMMDEVYYFERGEYPSSAELDELAEEAVVKILEEYVRQHFEESTKAAARMFLSDS